MEYKAQYQHNFLILCLLLLLLLTSFPSTMANFKDNLPTNPGDANANTKVTYGFSRPAPDAPKEDQNKKGQHVDLANVNCGEFFVHLGPQSNEETYQQCAAEFECRCPSVCECPLTLEPDAFKQLKKNLAPVIRQRLKKLFKKELTVESAIEAAHTIDLLKLLNESTSELNVIRDNVHNSARLLRDAFDKIPEYM
ncbi:Histone-lysine N-methyltransferase [Actinidia chinensis var. chinensis]|uniref:Histone-lysine N-methyltransferase n=1 Tax=Actinidia chinensis var. chinensis TaxID=1590841 RepID=A0A2R6RRN6_ACTCC|nr:Histone-lysine N-methyltransferase [Actinidia chinensis var. chinensis]